MSKNEDEIKVTEAMIEAGEKVLSEVYLGDGVYDVSEETLRRLFLAMCKHLECRR